MTYRQLIDPNTSEVSTQQIQRTSDDGTVSVIPNDPANSDWAAYQAWLALGNTPYVAD